MKPDRIELQIETLILDGFDPAEGPRIAAAIQAGLMRCLAARGISPALARGGSHAALAGGTVEVCPGCSPEALGRQVAEAVSAGLSRETAQEDNAARMQRRTRPAGRDGDRSAAALAAQAPPEGGGGGPR